MEEGNLIRLTNRLPRHKADGERDKRENHQGNRQPGRSRPAGLLEAELLAHARILLGLEVPDNHRASAVVYRSTRRETPVAVEIFPWECGDATPDPCSRGEFRSPCAGRVVERKGEPN